MSRLATIDELPDVPMTKHHRYAAYAPSGSLWLGNLPSHWKIRRLKFVARSQPSNVDKKTADGEIPVRLCNYVDVYKNDYITPDLDFMHATADPTELAKFRLRQGDVLITKDSEEWNDIAVPAYVTQDFEDLACGYHLSQVRPHASVMNGEYLFRAFRASGVAEQFHVRANGITRFGLAAGAIGDVVFPIPPVDEQRVIASFLRRETACIDALIAKKQRLIELLANKRTALVSQAVTKGLNPTSPMKGSGHPAIGSVPAHWTVRRLKYGIGFQEGPGIMAVDFRESGVPLLRIGNLTPGKVTLNGCNFLDSERVAQTWTHFRVNPGDYLISCSATTGVVSQVGPEAAGAVPYTGIIRLWPNRREVCAPFVPYLVASQPYLDQIASLKAGVAIQHYGPVHLRRITVAFPPPDEQEQIVAVLDRECARLERTSDAIGRAVERLREYRSALISAAVTGTIDVREESAHG